MTDETDETESPNILLCVRLDPSGLKFSDRPKFIHHFGCLSAVMTKGHNSSAVRSSPPESTAEIWGSAARSRFSSHRRSIHASDGRASRTPSQ